MDKTRLSIDSLGESEVDRLRDTIQQKDAIIAEKSEIIKSLRQQVSDFKEEFEQTENTEQIYHQKIDRLTKDLEEKNEHLEAVTHSLHEIETAHDNLSSKYEARIGQLKELFDDLKKTKKEMEKLQRVNEDLNHKNERLTVELEIANTRKRVWVEEEERARSRRIEANKLSQEETRSVVMAQNTNRDYPMRDIRADREIQKQRLRLGEVTDSENLPPELTQALHFPMADEVGEIMDSSSALPLTPSTMNRPLQRQQWRQTNLTARSTAPATRIDLLNREVASLDIHDQNYPVEHGVNYLRADSEIVDQNNDFIPNKQYCPNHKPIPTVVEKEKSLDPLEEYKMRVARANELARRNKLTKPLHQTSYALELDTFDTTNLTEQEIKRGNVSKAVAAAAAINRQQHAPALSSSKQSQCQKSAYAHPTHNHNGKHHHPQRLQQQQRNALIDRSNTPPVARRVYKKAEAFVV